MVLKALIDDNGKVTSARVVEGNAALAQAAISAVMQFRYNPYVRDGKALPFQTVVLLDFPRP
jgi:TonB family protein